MHLRTPIWLLISLLVPVSASAAIEKGRLFETASAEFECKAPELADGEGGDEEELFDENQLPAILQFSRDNDEPKEEEEQSAADEAADDAEMQAWREAYDRYKLRTGEFADEVNRTVVRKYDEEVRELRDGYERLVGKADIEERMLRQQAVEAHEKFIKDHPDSRYTARRMFRLAELYFEQSEEEYLAENEKYDELTELFDEGKLDYLPEPPLKDYRKSIVLYKRIVRDFTDYEDLGAVYYMLGYTYSDETSRHLDPARAEQTYLDLISNVVDSEYRAQAFFRLGDLYFEENDQANALSYYDSILGEFERRRAAGPMEPGDERLYELALYKLAWAYYKIDNLDTAISRFRELLDWAEEKEARTGTVADLKPESVRYLAISLSDKAADMDMEPVDYALSALRDELDKPWAFPVLVELAAILKDQARFEEAIYAYERLQELNPNHPDGPDFQNNVIVLNQNVLPPDPQAAADARVALTERYGLESAWAAVNKNNKEATARATEYILESLQWVAFTFHSKAQETGDPNDYLLAARKYLEYLERYPFAKNAYELNYYLADCYFWVGEMQFDVGDGTRVIGWQKAIEQYALLFGFPERDYRREAILGIMFAYNNLWKTQATDITTVPQALANLQPALGEVVEYETVPLSDLEKNYIRAVRWVQRDVPDYTELAVVLYDIAQVYYYKNHITSARRIFDELIEGHPQTDFASFAAGLMINTYRYTGDLSGMRAAAARVASLQLGQDDDLSDSRNQAFTVLARNSLFKEGEIAYNAERFDCALLAFTDYYDKYGSRGTDSNPENIDFVVYNIAQSYAKLGKTDTSNEFYELLLADFPNSSQAPRTFWRMASNYERILELDKAVRYYADLITYHPGAEDALAALYNTAFLRQGLKQFDRAAETYETYHDRYVEESDAKNMLFRAAEMWEASGDLRQTRRVYDRWLELYGAEDADRWVETKWKIASLLRDDGDVGDADDIVEEIRAAYPAIKDDLGGIGTNICASIAFQPLVAQYDEYALLVLPVTEDQEALREAVERKATWNTEIIAIMDAFVLNYADFEWQSAALYYKALSIKNHGETWATSYNPYQEAFDAGDPDAEELFFIYQDVLLGKADELYAVATDRFKDVVNLATQKKRHTKWVTEALRELNRIEPDVYPVPKPEASTVIESEPFDLPTTIDEIPEESSARPTEPTDTYFAARETTR